MTDDTSIIEETVHVVISSKLDDDGELHVVFTLHRREGLTGDDPSSLACLLGATCIDAFNSGILDGILREKYAVELTRKAG